MRRVGTAIVCGLVLALALPGASAAVGEKVEAAGKAASGAAVKTENVVKRGLKAAGSGVERGAKAAGKATTSVAKKIGVPGAGASAPKGDPNRDNRP